MRILSLVSVSLFVVAMAASAFAKGNPPGDTGIERVRAYREGDLFTTELQTNEAWNGVGTEARFAADTVQFDFNDISFGDEKQLIKVDDRVFKSVYVTQGQGSPVRVRLTLKPGFSAASLERAVHIRKSASGITIEVAGDANKAAKGAKSETMVRNLAIAEDEGTEEFSSAKLVATGKTLPSKIETKASADKNAPVETAPASTDVKPESVAAASTETAAVSKTSEKVDTSKLAENEIPLNLGAKETKKSEPASFNRILITLGVLLTFLAGLTFVLKRWAAKKGNNKQNTKIKILTQHHLGPKKSLAIIQVAGEAILIGMTDQNISMLKTLSLIDDEVPEQLPGNFDHALQNFDDEIEAPRTRSLPTRIQAALSGSRRENTRENTREITRENTREATREPDDFAMREISEIRDTVSGRLKNMRNF